MSANTPKLRGVAAITGAAGGIGQAIAKAFYDAGFAVAIGDLDEAAAKATAEQLGPRAVGLPLDVTSSESYREFYDNAIASFGQLTHIVLGAGVMWVGDFRQEPERAQNMQLAVNLGGVITGFKTGVPVLHKRGRMITIASAGSLIAPPGEATYAASKHGVLGYLKAVRAELHGSGIGVTAIMPGVVDTKLAAGTASGAAPMLTPDEVGVAVLREGLRKKPRFEVTLPGFIGPLNRFVNILPRPARDMMLRLMVPNQLQKTNTAARKDYESRFEA